MPVLQVLIDASGNVVGSATAVAATGTGAPTSVTLVAATGQRVTQVTVDDKTAALDADALHAALKTLVK